MDFDDQKQQRKLTELARRIKQARLVAQMSQEELATLVGLSDKSISAYEQNRSVPPLKKLKKIAEATNHPLSYFTQEDSVNIVAISTKLDGISRELEEIKRIMIEIKK